MCGRVTLKTTKEEIEEFLGITLPGPIAPRYNIAPTQPLWVARRKASNDGLEMACLNWGLTGPGKSALINVRSETAATKSSFKTAFRERRCIIPVDGFYEWKGSQKKRQPYHFRMRGGGLFALAGLWNPPNASKDDRDEPGTCAVLTTVANDLVSGFHDRMPLIIDPANFHSWLKAEDAAVLHSLMKPYLSDSMISVPVGQHVNNARNEGEKCLEPPREEKPERTLWDL